MEARYDAFGYPNDIVEHNYCGGSWFAGLQRGTVVRVIGGTQPGLYVVNGRRFYTPKTGTIAGTKGLGDLMVQTCISHTEMVYVGLTRHR